MNNLYPNIICDEQGLVIVSNQNYFELSAGKSIGDTHPFFESLFLDIDTLKEPITFNGVHIDDQVYDITAHFYTPERLKLKILDVTAIYERIQAIAQRKNESLIFNEILQLKNEFFKERDNFKDEFLSNFSAEIRNPLTLIHAFSSMMAKSDLDFEQQQLMDAIRSQATGILSLVDGMSKAANSNYSSIKFVQSTFSFKEVYETALESFNNQLRLLGTQSEASFDKEIPSYIYSDPDKLLQAINHFFRFILYQVDADHLNIHASQIQRRANIATILITASHKKSIGTGKSEALDQINIEDRAAQNLSLQICKELLELMNGSLNVESMDNDMISYSMRFKVRISKPNATIENSAEEPAAYTLKRKIKTLIVEDQAAAQMALVKILTSSGNFDTYVYTDARKIIDLVELDDDLDLIIIADSINQTDAIELLKMMKNVRNMSNRTLKYMALTLTNDDKENKKYLRHGFHQVIGKPYDEDRLLGAIYRAVDLKLYR